MSWSALVLIALGKVVSMTGPDELKPADHS